MKAAVLYFASINEREQGELSAQIEKLKQIYGDLVEFLPQIPVGSSIPKDADLVVFPW